MTNPVLPCKTEKVCDYLATNLTGAADCWFSGDRLPSLRQFPSAYATSSRGLMAYWRLSVQIYLELSDFDRLGRAVLNRTRHPEFLALNSPPPAPPAAAAAAAGTPAPEHETETWPLGPQGPQGPQEEEGVAREVGGAGAAVAEEGGGRAGGDLVDERVRHQRVQPHQQ